MKKKTKKAKGSAIRKKTYRRKDITKKEAQEERDTHYFNDGRLATDKKWIDAIDRRIKELEEQVGIPELRRLKQKTMYRWKEG